MVAGDRDAVKGQSVFQVNIDVSAELDGYWADTGASFPVGTVSAEASALLHATRLALQDGMSQVRAGAPLRNIGRAVERRAKQCGFKVIRNLCGHGVGRNIHEEPSVPNTFDCQDRTVLRAGLVITIEPFLTLGAQFEHTMIVTGRGPIVIT
jgi:methionyl aminopeptidase